MRDRLIELIQNAVNGCARHWAEVVADYLIENGVIVPTFSCGDRVWFAHKGLDEVCEAMVTRVEYNYFTSPQEWIIIEYTSSTFGVHEYKLQVDFFNEVLFTTKEEAEKALRGEGE